MNDKRLIIIFVIFSIVIVGSLLFHFLGNKNENSLHDLEDFNFIVIGIGYNEVIAKLGQPDRDLASGVYAPQYDLSDGSIIKLTFSPSMVLLGASIKTSEGIIMDYFEYINPEK